MPLETPPVTDGKTRRESPPYPAYREDLAGLDWLQRRINKQAQAKVLNEEQNQNRRRYCVYVQRDRGDQIRYIGHGQRSRAWSIHRRNANHRWMLACGELRVEILHDHLTAREAIQIEASLIEHARHEYPALLLNRLRGTQLEEITKDD